MISQRNVNFLVFEQLSEKINRR